MNCSQDRIENSFECGRVRDSDKLVDVRLTDQVKVMGTSKKGYTMKCMMDRYESRKLVDSSVNSGRLIYW